MLANYHPAPSAASSRKGIPIINDVLDVTEPSSHTERALVIIIAVAARPSVLRPPSYARGAKYFPHFRARGRRKIPRGPPAIARRINIDKGSAYVPGGMHTRAIFPAGRVSRDVVVRGGGGGEAKLDYGLLRAAAAREKDKQREREREREVALCRTVATRGSLMTIAIAEVKVRGMQRGNVTRRGSRIYVRKRSHGGGAGASLRLLMPCFIKALAPGRLYLSIRSR